MKHKLLLIMMSVGLLGSAAQADLFEFNGINQTITDNDSIGYVSTQTISGMAGTSLTDISISIALSGATAFNGDYYITLQNDFGFAVLVNRIGKTAANPLGYDDNGMDLTFSIAGADIHTAGDVAGDGTLTGTFAADGRITDPDTVLDTDARTALLDSFLSSNPNGEWRLFIADLSSGGEAQLNSWSLDLQAVPEPTTLALVSLSGGLLLVINRRRRVKI